MRVDLVGRGDLLEHVHSAMGEGSGVLLVGEPGVGKTRLLAETVDELAAKNWHTETFVASAAARSVPFGPLISLLPSDATDRTQQIAGVRRSLLERAHGRPTVVAIDDGHLLDDSSLACLAELAHHSAVTVVGTARSTEVMPPDLTALWASEALVRIDVIPLDRAGTTEFVRRLLEGPVSEHLASQVWDRTRGVPLFVRELILDAVAQQLVSCDGDGDTWMLHGELSTGARVQELVEARMASLRPAARALLELLAVAEPVALELLSDQEGTELDDLEHRGLAKSEHLAGRWVARVEHPLIAEAVHAVTPSRRRLDQVREIAGRTIRAGCPTPGDALRAARWAAEAGEPLPAGVALDAGREALVALDLDRAAELARSALGEMRCDAHLLLGEALRLQARAHEAEAALAVAAELAEDDETIVRVAMWRSTLRAHHVDDPAGAAALLDAAAERVHDQKRALELRSEAAFLAGILGRFDIAVDTNRRILATADLDDAARWTALMNLLFGQVMLADLDGIDEPIDEMDRMLEKIGPTRPEGVDLYWALVCSAQMLRGDLAGCETRFVAYVQRSLADEHLHGLTAAILVYPLLYRGSRHCLATAIAACEDTDQADAYMVGPIAHAGHTIACAHLGDLDGARAALGDVDTSHTGDLRLEGFIGRARAAVLGLQGRFDEAAQVTAAAGRKCRDGTYRYFGAVSLYDAVRYGRADLVVDDLRSLAESESTEPAPLIAAMVAHAHAQATKNTAGLVEVAARFAAMDARVLVTDALYDAARIDPDGVPAGRAATAAVLWRRTTPEPNAGAPTVESPLSDRELDVAELALRGRPSKEIAEELFVSVRTVDNHLAQVYRKLAVKGRSGLAEALILPPYAD